MQQPYTWSRYWCPRGGSLSLDDHGFLMDPTSHLGEHRNQSLRTLEQLQDKPCLVLLGEPGIGKSYALEGARKAQLNDDTSLHILLDLKGRSEASLFRFFEREPYSTWLRSQGHLTLWIDSLDESVDRLLPNALLELLESAPRERLSLRIVCRTAVWPTTLEERLKRLWSDLETWELVPVSRADVEAAAKTRGIDAPSFMAQIEDRDVGALASRPVTLELLFSLFERGSVLPDSRLEVYRKGLEPLCEEPDHARPRAGDKGTLPLHARKVIAGRIAVLTLLCGRDTIWTGRAPNLCPEGAIDLETLTGGTERSNGDEIFVTHDRVQEVLNSSLFSDRGHVRLGWAHRTFMEVLAAEYLVETRLPALMLLGKLIHPDDDEQEVAPQFYGLAAWLTEVGAGDEEEVDQTRASDLFELLVQRQPELLLGCDLQRHPEHRRAKVVERLLQRYGDNKIDRGFMQGWLQEQRLFHAGLAEQLRPYLVDRERAWEARCAALYIARACKLASLQEEYLSLALDPQEHIGVRCLALYALEEMGSTQARERLRPILSLPAELDPFDELHGGALSCLWPDHLSPEELFQHLHVPRHFGYFGHYQGFIERTLSAPLRNVDVLEFFPPALRWIQGLATLPQNNLAGGRHQEIGNEFAAQAWKHLEHAPILEAFADLQVTWMKAQHELVGVPSRPEPIDDIDAMCRRRLAYALIHNDNAVEISRSTFVVCLWSLLSEQDLDWLVERFLEAKDDSTRGLIRDVIRMFVKQENLQHLEWLSSVIPLHPMLESTFRPWIQVELGSPLAESLKADFLRWQTPARLGTPTVVPVPPTPSPAERVLMLLEESEADPLRYWLLERELTLIPKGTHYAQSNLFLDIREHFGWESASPDTRARIVQVARQFLETFTPQQNDWDQPGQHSETLAAGLHAFYLLKAEVPQVYEALPIELWERWAPALARVVIVNARSWGIPLASSPDYPGLDGPLLADAYARVPARVLEVFSILLMDSGLENDHPLLTSKLHTLWDAKVTERIFKWVKDEQLPINTWRTLMGDLLKRQTLEALTWALECAAQTLPTEAVARHRRMGLALCLMVHATATAWPVLWQHFEPDVEFGRTLLETWLRAPRDQELEVLYRLPSPELEALLRWLLKQYPFRPSEPSGLRLMRRAPASFDVERLRESLLARLQKSATPEAVDVLKRLEQSSPQPEFLRRHIREGLRIMRERGFPPQEPRALLKWLKGGALQQFSERLLGAITLPEPVSVFVSYAREDLALIQAIKPMLMVQRVSAFVDVVDLRGGELWEAELRRHIGQAQHVFVFWSRWSSTSPEVEKEWRYALVRMERDGLADRFIIPIILDGKKPNKDHPLARFQYLFFQAGQLEWERPGE